MKLAELVEKLELEICSGGKELDQQVTGAYVSDLLSDVMAHAEEGNLWITLQIHQNIVAVATLKEMAAVILIGGRRPEDEAVEKANEEGVVILATPLPAFELAGRLYEMGVRGN